jgi:hypothetical protein
VGVTRRYCDAEAIGSESAEESASRASITSLDSAPFDLASAVARLRARR